MVLWDYRDDGTGIAIDVDVTCRCGRDLGLVENGEVCAGCGRKPCTCGILKR